MSEKKAILVASYGTSYDDTREKTIGAIERHIAESFPGWEVRRAFTSRPVIRILEKRGIHVDFVDAALDRLADEGYGTVVVQPTLVMNGVEYDYMMEEVEKRRDRFDAIAVGRPLLTTSGDFDALIRAILSAYGPEADGDTMVLMGHGTTHFANSAYSELQLRLIASGHRDVYVTTVEGFPDYDSTLGLMEAVPAGSEAVPVAETSVANNFVTSLVNRSYASGLAYQNGSPNRGFLGFVVAVDGFNAKQISTVSGLESLSKPRLEIEAVGGSLPSTLAGLRADSFLPFRAFYTALYQVLAGGNAVLDRSADQSYASLVSALNNEGMKLENADVIGLGATLLDSYFYEVLAGGRYIHSQVEITSTMVSSPTDKPLSQSEISILAGAPLDLTGDAKYFGTNSYLQQAYRLLS